VAPAGAPAPELLSCTDLLVVNEGEATVLAEALGWAGRDAEATARRIDGERGVGCIVTLGGEGLVAWLGGEHWRLPAPPVAVIDTVAAGDSFTGAFAAALDGGAGFSAALRFGLAAGSLACTRRGAQPSVPRRAEIEALAGTTWPW